MHDPISKTRFSLDGFLTVEATTAVISPTPGFSNRQWGFMFIKQGLDNEL